MANWWDAAPKVSAFDLALDAEGVSGKVADIARSIYQQESGSGKNTKTSNAGAVGGMQIIPGTFASVADKGWDISNPEHNARAGVRYVKQLYEQAGGDPALTAAGYYGGPGGLEKARRGVAVSDPRNPSAPTTLQYGQQVAARIPKDKGLIQRGVEAVIPSAEAAPAQGNWWDSAPVVEAEKPMPAAAAPAPAEEPGALVKVGRAMRGIPLVGATAAALTEPGVMRNVAKGVASGFADVGDTIKNAGTKSGADVLSGINSPLINPDLQRPNNLSSLVTGQNQSPAEQANTQRNASLEAFNTENKDAPGFTPGRIAGNVAATYPVGGALGKVAGAVSPTLGNAIASGGMSLGGPAATTLAGQAGQLGMRATGGAINGYTSAGLVDPASANTGALIGGALPIATKAVGEAGKAIGRGIAGQPMAPEVKALADRAKQLGIEIPADRLVNSKPLNALASSLEYVPMSGRTGTINKMEDQMNRAVSRTFGQNSENVTMALRKAGDDLGAKFDTVLSSNKVKLDQPFLNDLADAANMATKELPPDAARVIHNQVDDIMKMAQNGEIEGQAAYNIKKTLDRIGRRNSPEGFYALDLKGKLMEALNRSLGPAEADAFKVVRQQYGNMLALEKLAANGAEGGVSAAKLANLKNINNPELQEIADIAAQFVKGREGAHGAAQRAFLGSGAAITGAATGTLPAVATGMALGRGTNMLLNSGLAKNMVSGNKLLPQGSPDLAELLYRGAPAAVSPGR
jgi:hypothetical protein